MECPALRRPRTGTEGSAAPSLASRGRGRGLHAMCPTGCRTDARKFRGIPIDTDDFGQTLRRRARAKSMNHSPLETAIIFHLGIVPVSRTVVTTWGLMAVLTVTSWIATRSFRVDAGGWQAMVETVVVGIEDQIALLLNLDAAPFLPLLGTLFIFLAVANLCGIVPGVTAPTASIETPAALAVIVFLAVHFYGVRIQGLGAYLKGYLKPNPVMLPFNILSELTRSFSLAMRLFGNIMSEELVLAIILVLAGLLVPIPFMAFGILVGLVQAYIFSVLAAVYIGGGIGTIAN